MPQIPVIAPLIVVSLAVGAIIKSKSSRISKKRFASTGLVAGLLNSIHGYFLYSLAPTQIVAPVARPATGASALGGFSSASAGAFVAASFLAGFLVVVLVLGIAVLYARLRRAEELVEVPEQIPESEPTLAPS
jgi:hypothetical protein